MPRVVYDIPDNAKEEEILKSMRQEKNAVIRERLFAVSMFLDGVPKGDIKQLMHRSANFVGTWISAYFSGGIEALDDNRGGNHSSYLDQEQMQELKRIITITIYSVLKSADNGDYLALIEMHKNTYY